MYKENWFIKVITSRSASVSNCLTLCPDGIFPVCIAVLWYIVFSLAHFLSDFLKLFLHTCSWCLGSNWGYNCFSCWFYLLCSTLTSSVTDLLLQLLSSIVEISNALSDSEILCVCVHVHVGLPPWPRAAPGASAVLWSRHERSECLRKHCSTHLCPIQPGEQGVHACFCTGFTIVCACVSVCVMSTKACITIKLVLF